MREWKMQEWKSMESRNNKIPSGISELRRHKRNSIHTCIALDILLLENDGL